VANPAAAMVVHNSPSCSRSSSGVGRATLMIAERREPTRQRHGGHAAGCSHTYDRYSRRPINRTERVMLQYCVHGMRVNVC
jgi:hypothetical protein